MSTYQIRVEDKIGAISDTAALSDFLTAGAKFFVNILPLERIEKFTTDLTDSGSGVSVTTSRVLRAHKSSYGARRISADLAAQAANSSSIHYAGSTDPVWYILNGLAFIKPSGGTVVAMAYPTVAYGDSTISAFPADLDEGVVLYACIHGRLRQMSDLTITTLGGLSISTIVKPIAPASPSFTWTDVTYTDAVYSAASYLSQIYNNASYTDAAYSAPSYNDAVYGSAIYSPQTYIDALIDTITSTSVSFSDTLSYVPPVFSGSYTNVDTALTNQDIELSNAHLSKVNSQLEGMQKDLLVSLNEFNKDKGEFDAALQIALTDAQLTQQRLIEQTRLQVELNKFNEQQAIQTALQNAQQESQIDLANRKAELELSLANKAKELEAALVNATKTTDVDLANKRAALELDITNKAKEVETALANAIKQAEVDLANKRSALELDITNRSKALEVLIVNESKDLERQIQEYSAKLQNYGQEINGYSITINEEVSRVSQRINQYNAMFQQHAVGLEALRQEFQNFIKVI